MRFITKLFLNLLMVMFVLFIVVGCEKTKNEGPAERTGKNVDKIIKKAKDKVLEVKKEAGEVLEEAGEKMQEGIEEAGEDVEDAADKTAEKIKKTGENVEKSLRK